MNLKTVTLFYRQVILQHRLPFTVRLLLRTTMPVAPAGARSVRGKYEHIPTSSEEFAQRKQAEIAHEG